jgi:outer membrane lipoprotein-sorting protein
VINKPGKYKGMTITDPRKQVIRDLKDADILFKQQKQKQERAGSMEAGGFLLKKEYLFKIERESVSESSGMKVAIVEDKDFILEITK